MAGVGADDRQGQEIGASMWIMGKATSAWQMQVGSGAWQMMQVGSACDRWELEGGHICIC